MVASGAEAAVQFDDVVAIPGDNWRLLRCPCSSTTSSSWIRVAGASVPVVVQNDWRHGCCALAVGRAAGVEAGGVCLLSARGRSSSRR